METSQEKMKLDNYYKTFASFGVLPLQTHSQRNMFDKPTTHNNEEVQLSFEDIEYLNTLDQKFEKEHIPLKVQNTSFSNFDREQTKQQSQNPFLSNHVSIKQNNDKNLSPSNYYDSAVGLNINIHTCEEDGKINQKPFVQKYNLQKYKCIKQNEKKLKWSKKDLVYEKLSSTHKPQYIEVARLIKELEEKKKCTFKPVVNQQGRRYNDPQELFERLHHEKVFKEQDIAKREQIKLQEEMMGCTFSPSRLKTRGKMFNNQENEQPNSERDSRIFDKLYNDYKEIQKKKTIKVYEKQERENAENTFRPQVIKRSLSMSRNTNDSQSQDKINRFEHLYQDSARRAESLKKKIQENKENNQSKNQFQRSKSNQRANMEQENTLEAKPRYVTLYENHQQVQNKKKQLQKKIYEDMGITFKPQQFRRHSLSVSSQSTRQQTQSLNQDLTDNKKKGTLKKNKFKNNLPPRPK